MQVVDANGNVFGQGLEITGIDGKPKVPVINTDITIGTTVINGGVSGRLLFDDAGVLGETANISWNKATNILTLNGDITYTTYNRTIASSTYPLGTLFTGTIRSISQINHSGGTNGLTIGGNGGSPIFRIWDNGNVTIQLNGTYVDAGYRLDVNGTTRLQRTLDLGSVGYAGTINLRRAGDGGITSQITQTDNVTVIHNYQGSGTEFKVDNVTYFHVRGFANQYAARVMGNLTAVSGLSTALLVNNAISASANNDVLIGLDVAPTFTNGAFTGLSNFGLRISTSTQAGNNGGQIAVKATDGGIGVIGIQGNGWGSLGLWGPTRYTVSATPDIRVRGNDGGIMIENFLLIGATTNAGFKLDVNGTGRFSGSLTINNDMVINSVGDRSITWAVNDLRFMVGANNIARFFTTGTVFISTVGVATTTGTSVGPSMAGITASSATFSATFFANPQVNHLQTKMLIGGNDGAYGGNTTQGIGLWIYGGNNTTNNSYGNVVIAHDGTTARGNVLIGTSTNVPSAVVNVNSTTQGFLPPRMTNAQMLAIATPAAGLIVYDTTNNKHYGYDGTTWNPFY